MTLETWISANGGRVKTAHDLGVSTMTVHHWLRSFVTPRAETVLKIVALSGGRVTIDDIIRSTKYKKPVRR